MDELEHSARSLAAAFLDSSSRLYSLDIDVAGHGLAVERWCAEEALSADRSLHIDCLSPRADLDLDAFIGERVDLRTRLPDGSDSTRSGLVREIRALGADGGLARYRLVAVSWWWLLDQGRHSRVFQDQSVLEIVESVFAGHAPHASWQVAPEVSGALAARRPRSYCVQYRESDQAFCARLLAEEGLGFRVEDDPEAPGGHRLLIFDDSSQLSRNPACESSRGGIRFHRADATESEDSVQRFIARRDLIPTRLSLLSHDYRRAASSHAALPLAGSIDTLSLESYDTPGAYAFAGAEEAEALLQRQAEAIEARQATWQGLGTVRGFAAGTWFTLGHAPDTPEHDGREWLLTRLRQYGINNLPRTLLAAASQHLGPAAPFPDVDGDGDDGFDAETCRQLEARAEASGYANAWHALPRETRWRPCLADDSGIVLNPRPTAPGPQTAVVIGADGHDQPQGHHELHCDALGRVRLRFHWQRDHASCWVRVAQRHAGPGVGAQFLPRIGHEVLVDFLDGDIDRPIVIGSLYNGCGEGGLPATPGGRSGQESDGAVFADARDHAASAQGNTAAGHSPAWHGASPGAEGHRNAAALSGYKSKEFGGSGYSQLVFDDSDGQGRVQLATTTAASQLNLGHLIHQADNYRGSFRGEGFELRTDAWGSVRAESGLLIDSGTSASSIAGDNVPGVALLRQMVELAEGFDSAAGSHRTVALASHRGAAAASGSTSDAEHAPAAALLRSALTQVPGTDYDAAMQAAPDKSSSGDSDALPHSGDAQLTLVGRAGLGLLAGQSLQLHCRDVLQLASGADSQACIAGDLRIHAGQAIGWVTGATGNGEGLSLIAANGSLDVQAQNDSLALRGRDDVRIASANAELEAAAGKRIHLAVEGGASITIENGNITIACPGQIRVHAAKHSFVGPTQLSREMNAWPETKFNERFQLRLHNGHPAANQAYELLRGDGARVSGVTDAEGFLTLQQGLGAEQVTVRIVGQPAGSQS